MTQEKTFGKYIKLLPVLLLWTEDSFGDCINTITRQIPQIWIFDIFSMPVPIKNQTVPDDTLSNMVAWYSLETSSIAVNLNKMEYILLSKKGQDHCSSPLCCFGDVQSPLYSITSSKLYMQYS